MNLRAALATASLVFASTVVTTTFSPDVFAQGIKGEWKVPAKKASKPNPVPATAHSKRKGRELFVSECAQCHGPEMISPQSIGADLSRPEVWTQTDGTIFWKVKTGKGRMPSYHKLSKTDIWNLTNYMRDEFSN